MPNPIESLLATGTKLWLDSIDPDLVRLNRATGATGATSNPIIVSDLLATGRFDQAIEGMMRDGLDDTAVAWRMTDRLVRDAQAVFLPVWEAIQPVITNVLTKPSENRAAQAAVYVEVWNGSGYAEWDQLAADRLVHAGYVPILGNSDGNIYPQTQIVYFSEVTKGIGLPRLQSLFKVSEANTLYQQDDAAQVKLRLILGQDYVTCQ